MTIVIKKIIKNDVELVIFDDLCYFFYNLTTYEPLEKEKLQYIIQSMTRTLFKPDAKL